MKPSRYWLEIPKAFYQYGMLRQRKGILGQDFIYRSIRFAAARLFGVHRTHARSPLIATLSVTSRCPLDCYHCSEGYEGEFELPMDTILSTLDELVALGCPSIALTGGEPLCRPELLDFLDRIPSSTTAMIFTSGNGLTKGLSDSLAQRRNLLACFSLDHSDPNEHDRRRGSMGSHAVVMRGIELLSNRRTEIHVSSMVTRDRISSGELPRFVRSLKRHGVACVQLFQPRPVGCLGHESDLFLRPDEEAQLLEIVCDLNQDPTAPLVISYPAIERSEMLGCCGGYARVHIDSRGHVCPCDFAPLSFGLVTQEPLAAIWERMRSFFALPGSCCLVRDNPEVFGGQRKSRNVMFSDLIDPHRLHSSPPGLFNRFGEKGYRLLLSSLTLSSAAVCQWNSTGRHD
jgi:MoaA/NifB/PqqE/SkfB family radical SAM enzyme